jgi:hypothetical protein
VLATRWFLSAPREPRRWEGPACAVLGASMALVHLAVMALVVFLWVHND